MILHAEKKIIIKKNINNPLAMFVPKISYQTPHMKKPLLQSLSLILQVTSPA